VADDKYVVSVPSRERGRITVSIQYEGVPEWRRQR
jgi:hypothetical protein